MARLPENRAAAQPTFASGLARQANIIRVMRELTTKNGADAVRMQDVARESDVALNTLYRYFPSKSHLLVAILEQELKALADGGPPASKAPARNDVEATDRVLNFLAPAAESMFSRPLLARAMLNAAVEPATAGGEPLVFSYQYLEDAALAILGINDPTEQDRRMMFTIHLTWSSAISAVLNGRLERGEYDKVLHLTVAQLIQVRSV